MKKKILAGILSAFMLLSSACSGDNSSIGEVSETTLTKENIKAGFVYTGSIDDKSYTQAHDEGRKALNDMGIQTEYVENVPANEDSVNAIIDLIEKGCNVIYTTSSEYDEYTKIAADQYPEIIFNNCSGDITSDNLGIYSARTYEARYILGIVAAMNSKTKKIGYIAPKPIPEVIRDINAFTLGVRSVSEEASVEVVFTDTWNDEIIEKTAVLTLISDGKNIDVIASQQNSLAVQKFAEEKGVLSIGNNYSTSDTAPKSYLTASVYNWSEFYVRSINSIINDEWSNKTYWEGISSGIVDIDDLTNINAENVSEKVKEVKEKIKAGELNIFSGEIYDQYGNIIVEKDDVLSDDEIWQMNWFVNGVVGKIAE